MLADLSNFPPVPIPYGDYHFHDGHRLWHAPEAMPRSYFPDDGEMAITDLPDGVLFRKTFRAQAGFSHPDNNCNTEIYCNDQFVELESLAPLVKLNPGASVSHVESWDIFYGLDSLPEEIQKALIVS